MHSRLSKAVTAPSRILPEALGGFYIPGVVTGTIGGGHFGFMNSGKHIGCPVAGGKSVELVAFQVWPSNL